MSLIQLAVLAIVAVVLGLFVLRPILLSPVPETSLKIAGEPAALEIEKPSIRSANLIPLTGEIADDTYVFPSSPGTAIDSITGQPDTARNVAEPVERLRQLIAERQDETVEILRGWLEDKGERA
jgi:flagellar M-ring protein FliF